MYFYSPKLKQKVAFEPLVERTVRMYVCGPTVYDDAHLGHARSSIVFDLIVRILRACGYKVTFVKNYTDIDDKILAKAKAQNVPISEISARYIKNYERDMSELNCQRPDLTPHATQNLPKIISFISHLLSLGAAYKNDKGDIYLSVSKDAKYGSLSGRGVDDSNIARVAHEDKADLRDFALWKADELGFEAPFGSGRPGWHIECSAMIDGILSYTKEESLDFCIDIHGGGSDLAFPHHENEACQIRLKDGRELAKYWIHNEFVNINGQKMSKSLNNSFFVKDALKVYDGEILRNYLLGVHYKNKLDFNEQDLLASKKRLDKIYHLKRRLNTLSLKRIKSDADDAGNAGSSECGEAFLRALSDDVNISLALSILDEFINNANKALDSGAKEDIFTSDLEYMCDILGLGYKDAVAYFQLGVSKEQRLDIELQIKRRREAKAAKNYELADNIRSDLRAQNIALLDLKDGSTIWEKID
ncbi:MAG: cysteine--tRNA ligase [Helicobacter sp.]|nr:cysteine--tRNA ligase [Helicobacter sp.]